MEPIKRAVGVVIRRDGTVPFDADCHPDVKAAIIQHLQDQGHTLTHHPEGHLTIHDWKPPEPGVEPSSFEQEAKEII